MPEKLKVEVDVVSEQAVLGAALRDPKVRTAVVRKLTGDMFLASPHRALYSAIKECEDRCLDPTNEALAAHGDSREWGGPGYVDVLRSAAAPKANLRRHVEVVRWDATRASVIGGALASLQEALVDPRSEPERAQAAAQAVVSALSAWGARLHLRDPDGLARDWYAEFAVRRARRGFVPTGFLALDERLNEGYAKGRITVITGLSGMGKSTFAFNAAVRCARGGVPPAYGAWEMGSESSLDVIASMVSGVELGRVMKPWDLSEEDVAAVHEAVDWATQNIRFMDNPWFAPISAGAERRRGRPSNDANLDTLERYVAESGRRVIFLDLFERMLVDRDPEEGVAPALYRAHRIAEEYGVHLAILQQLRLKDVEKRPDKRPTREAVKGSAAYVEVADQIFGVHRDAVFKTSLPDDRIEVICLKQRKGRSNWSVEFGFDVERARIEGDGREVQYEPGDSSGDFFAIDGAAGVKPAKNRRPRRED